MQTAKKEVNMFYCAAVFYNYVVSHFVNIGHSFSITWKR